MGPKFKLKSSVVLIHDPERIVRMIVCYQVGPDSIRYCLACGTLESWHYEFELANSEKKITGQAGFINNREENQNIEKA